MNKGLLKDFEGSPPEKIFVSRTSGLTNVFLNYRLMNIHFVSAPWKRYLTRNCGHPLSLIGACHILTDIFLCVTCR